MKLRDPAGAVVDVTTMPTDNRPMNAGAAINNDTSRLDGIAKVTGEARYGRDMYLPNSLFIALVRCPFGAADFEGCDEAAARAVPGVIEVEVKGKECTYHGQHIGYVAADSPLAMRRALRALKPRWKRKPVKTQITDTVKDLPEPEKKTRDLLAKADATLEAVYTTPVQTHSSLETHGGSIDHRGDRATVYASTQGTSSVKDGLGDSLELSESEFEVVCEYVGGGFGSKLGGPGKEISTAARLAAKHKRPAYLFCNRSEEHLDTGNRPSMRCLVRVGARKDGEILGGEIRVWGGVGVGRGGGGANIPSGRYKLGDIDKSAKDVSFNGGGPRAFRAPGHPQGSFAEEMLIEELAARLALDPLEMRKKLVGTSHQQMLDMGARLIGWSDRRATGSQTGVMRVGYGCGVTSWGSAGPGGNAEVVIRRDGSVECRTGTQDIGTGQRTGMAIMAADALGVPLSVVTVRIGRSTLPPGPGSGGSVTSPMTAPTMAAAAADARQKLLERVADRVGGGAKGDEFRIVGGDVLRGDVPVFTWADACATLPPDGVTGRASKGEGGKGHSNGAQFVKLVVDSETGVVHVKHVIAIQACGRVICRKTAESQIIGGVIQGLSYALFEDKILDRNVGAMVNDNFEWYKILGPGDMPHIEPVLWTRGEQTGVKALGEPPTIPTAGAVACAIYNAIGRPVRDLPITPDRILAAMAQPGEGAGT